MRIALVPMRVDPNSMEANARTMASWIEVLHERAQLIVFPQMLVPPPDVDSTAAWRNAADEPGDLVRRFAEKRKIPIAVAFEKRRSARAECILMLTDRQGQLDAQTRRIDERSPDDPGAAFIAARVAGVRLGLAAADFDDQRVIVEANLQPVSAIIVPMHFGGNSTEIRRVAAHNPPVALPDLKERMADAATKARTIVLAVNAIGDDSDAECGPCGGVFGFGPGGDEILTHDLYDEAPVEFEIAT